MPNPVLLFACHDVPAEPWLVALQRAAPELEVRLSPDEGPPETVDFGLAWATPPGFWNRFPRLRAIFSLGAGVEHLLASGAPAHVPLVRMTDPGLARDMSDFVLMRVLHYHRGMHLYLRQQEAQVWTPIRPPRPNGRTVGVMGLGELGAHCACTLAEAGFRTRGWSRSAKAVEGVATFAGRDELPRFLEGCEILVCLLPLTAETRDILDAKLFAALPQGACLIQVGRGLQLVEADLLAALDAGRIAAATLDVFRQEPLPQGHPFWSRADITVVPHAAAFTYPETAAEVVAENVRRLQAGEVPIGLVDRALGY